jgi:hypothetical protein
VSLVRSDCDGVKIEEYDSTSPSSLLHTVAVCILKREKDNINVDRLSGKRFKMMNYFVHHGPFAEAVSRSAKLDVSRPYVIGMFVSVPREVKLDFLVSQLNSDHILALYCLKIHFNVVVPSIPGSSKLPFSIKRELARLTNVLK